MKSRLSEFVGFLCKRILNMYIYMYNQHTREMATTRHRSLVERGGRKALLEPCTHTKKKTGKKMSGKSRYPRISRKDSST